jgi:hypothetical protein
LKKKELKKKEQYDLCHESDRRRNVAYVSTAGRFGID